jgi:hypothetical protein
MIMRLGSADGHSLYIVIGYSDWRLHRLRGSHRGTGRAEERAKRVKALENWQAERAKHRAAYRVDELKAASDKAQEERYELWDQLAQTPAKSVTGIALKLAALFQWDDGLRDAWSGNSEPEFSDIMCPRATWTCSLPHTYGADQREGKYQRDGETKELVLTRKHLANAKALPELVRRAALRLPFSLP